jgi:hypothetical protein
VERQFPVTPTNKIIKRHLRAELWECADPVWWRPDQVYDTLAFARPRIVWY